MGISILSCMLTGCRDPKIANADFGGSKKSVVAQESTPAEETEPTVAVSHKEDDYLDEEVVDTTDETAVAEQESPVGTWYTDGYDIDNNWENSYTIELYANGSASCIGWLNDDIGTYTVEPPNKAIILFDKCRTYSEGGEGLVPAQDGYSYTVEMIYKGDKAEIKKTAPDNNSHLKDGGIYRVARESEPNTVSGTSVADGVYVTDTQYVGDITSDGSSVAVNTALNHYDENGNLVEDYAKDVYTFFTSKKCKCVIMQEEVEEYPIAGQTEFIENFLNGNTGLPVTLIIEGGRLTELQFSA